MSPPFAAILVVLSYLCIMCLSLVSYWHSLMSSMLWTSFAWLPAITRHAELVGLRQALFVLAHIWFINKLRNATTPQFICSKKFRNGGGVIFLRLSFVAASTTAWQFTVGNQTYSSLLWLQKTSPYLFVSILYNHCSNTFYLWLSWWPPLTSVGSKKPEDERRNLRGSI